MKQIPLTQGQFAIVDDKDYKSLSKHKWCYNSSHGATRIITIKEWRKNRKKNYGSQISMHREIMNPPDNMDIDHINHNRLNNRRKNLRICTRSQNLGNQRPIRGGSSKFKGVTKSKFRVKKGKYCWIANICFKGCIRYLGTFENEINAAKAYNKKAKELFGEFANINTL